MATGPTSVGSNVDVREFPMARSYYSTVFAESADDIWSVIRDFNNYSVWLPGTTSRIENEKSGAAIGAIRNVQIGDRTIRQRLLALSDIERSQVYDFCDAVPFPIRNYQATLRITPVIDGDRAFVEWWATFDCSADEHDHWTHYFAHEGFAKWLASLRKHLARA
jgi:hypothetical protein